MAENVFRTEITTLDEQEAVSHLCENLHKENLAGITFFCSDKYDLKVLEKLLNDSFDCPIIGCTTAGEIGSTYQNDGIVAASFSNEAFSFHVETISNLNDFNVTSALEIAEKVKGQLKFSDGLNSKEMFGFFLIDGLSMIEEHVAADFHSAFEGIEIIGCSVGDEWYVRSIQNYHEDESLTFACAITAGLPLTVGKTEGLIKSLTEQVESLIENLTRIEMILGFDCIHRRLEMIETGIKDEIEQILTPLKFLGFST